MVTHRISFLLAATLISFSSHSAIVTWNLSGQFTNFGVFSTFEVGDPWSLTLSFDDAQTGVSPTGFTTNYTGSATFISNSYIATDTSAIIGISDAPNIVSIEMGDDGANLPGIEFINFPGTFRTPEDINFSIEIGDIGSENLVDYIHLDTLAPFVETNMNVRVTSAISPTGTIDNVTVSAVPVPAAVWLFGSGLLGLVGLARRKKA